MSAPRLRNRYDAVVVGARCAGAATAMLLAREGLDVLAVEQGRYGSDTNSTLALMRGAVLQLERWGLRQDLEWVGTPAIRTTTFHYGDEGIELPIKPRNGIEALYAPRRTVLDTLLADAARDAGADVVYGVQAGDLLRNDSGRVEGVMLQEGGKALGRVEAGLVIGADGVSSGVALRAGAKKYRTARHTGGVVYGFFEGLDREGFHWHFNLGVAAGVIPTNHGQTLVFASFPAQRFNQEIRFDTEAGFHQVLGECSSRLAADVAAAHRVGSFRGFAGKPGYLRECHGPGWALVGDAGYFKDPITAHGLTDALRDAELLARAVVKGRRSAMVEYQATRDALSHGLFDVTDEIAAYDWSLEAVQDMHLRLSREMNREVDALVELHEEADAPVRRTA